MDEHQQMVEDCEHRQNRLSEWECEFIVCGFPPLVAEAIFIGVLKLFDQNHESESIMTSITIQQKKHTRPMLKNIRSTLANTQKLTEVGNDRINMPAQVGF